MADRHDLPFQVEYAKSNRSKCKSCTLGITQDTLRMAVMIQSRHFDGKVPNWFHYNCFWKKHRISNHQEIYNFDSLRYEDQKKIKDQIGVGGKGGAKGKSGGAADIISDFRTEYAKSSRSECCSCETVIEKGALRISKKDYTSEKALRFGGLDRWYHVDCFVNDREELEFGPEMGVNQLAGCKTLSKESQQELLTKLGKGSSVSKSNGLKRKDATNSKTEAKKAKKEPEDKKLQSQSTLLWKYHDKLKEEVSNDAQKILLEINGQHVPKGNSKILDALSDCMAFGALISCPDCPDGKLTLRHDGYQCTGNISSWTKCTYSTQKPKRRPFKVPTEYHDVDFLKKYKYKKGERVFAVAPAGDVIDGGLPSSSPLEGMKFAVIGNVESSEEIIKNISSLGGLIVKKVDKKTTACISNKESVDEHGKDMKAAKKANIPVVGAEFVEAVKNGGATLMIEQHRLSLWGTEPIKPKVQPKSSKSSNIKPVKAKEITKLTVKGAAAVDVDSDLADIAHVIEDRGAVYNAVLGLVDTATGMNSYYKLQALESDKMNAWWLFRAWGRVGTTIGGHKNEKFRTRKHAIERFKELYYEKTENEWDNRRNFEKFPHKYYPLDIDYGQDNSSIKKLDIQNSTSKLHKAIQELICMIFDLESMKKSMLEFEIDLKKMPLGKLSKKQIQSAYKVLNELVELIDTKASVALLTDAANRFYTLIPHDFGLNKIPLLDSAEIIKQKVEMLDNLLEIEIAYSLLRSGDDGSTDPVDAHYMKLKTDIEYLDKADEEFSLISTYVKNTHAATHIQYDLEVVDVFKVARHGEKERFSPFEELPNHKLLWHGSRITNFAGILSKGLQIAPPEAPVTGYMFGKGIYFADMVSKSANYCYASRSDPFGLLLLCDVALGNMYELTDAKHIQKLPNKKHSTKGCGMTMPDPSESTVLNGVEVPIGQGVPSDITNSSLLYNEYIVYDVAQVNIKYLLKLKFNYK